MKRSLPVLAVVLLAAPGTTFVVGAHARADASEREDRAASGASPSSEAAGPPAETLRAWLVDVLPGARQALLFDKVSGAYVLVKQGESLQGFRVAAIEPERVILQSHASPPARYVLALPTARGDRPAAERRQTTTRESSAPPRRRETGATAAESEALVPLDPYGPRPVERVKAPPRSRAGASAEGAPASPQTTTEQAPASPQTATEQAPASPQAATVQAPASSPHDAGNRGKDAVAEGSEERSRLVEERILRRADLNAALSDFEAIRKETRLARTDDGRIRIVHLSRGSFLHRAGLRPGDVVRTVSGRPVADPDKAAAAYVELTAARRFEVSLERAGEEMTIRYRVK